MLPRKFKILQAPGDYFRYFCMEFSDKVRQEYARYFQLDYTPDVADVIMQLQVTYLQLVLGL